MDIQEELWNQKKYVVELQVKLREAVYEGAPDEQLLPLITELKAQINRHKLLLNEEKRGQRRKPRPKAILPDLR